MSKRKTIYLFILYFLFAICVNVVHPITVNYVTSLELDDSYFGFFVSLMSLGQVVGALVFGFLSDKIGRKWIVVIGLLGYCLAQFGFGFLNESPIIILLFRFLAGVFIAAPITLFVSMCLDYSNEQNKVKNLTIFSSCYILGTSMGYEIGGALYNYASLTISQVFIFQIILTILTALFVVVLLEDVYLHNKENKCVIEEKVKATIKPIVYMLLLPLLILTMSQILINKYLDTYIIHIGYEPSLLGHFVLISGLFSAASNIAIIPLIKKLRNSKLAICLLVSVVLSVILPLITFGIKTNILYLLFSTHLLYIIIKGWITPLEQNEIATYTNANNKGKITGLRQTILSTGNVIGPLIGSAIYTKGSPTIFIVASMIALLSLVFYIIYFAIKKKTITISKEKW